MAHDEQDSLAFVQEGRVLATATAIISALGATVGLFVTWQKWREASLRRGDVLAWANDVIHELQSLLLICILRDPQLEEAAAKARLTDIIFNTSILVERGRLFFKNKVADDLGHEKESAYRGYRPRILDPIVVAHQVACGWVEANEDTRLRMRLIAEDCLKKFVSLAQKEVGRDRTASVDTSQGGEGLHLRHLLSAVNHSRLEALRRTGH
jgi:hypothetical protein